MHLEKKLSRRRCESTVYIRATRNTGDDDGYDCDYDYVPQWRKTLEMLLKGVHLVMFVQRVHSFTCAGVYLIVSVIE